MPRNKQARKCNLKTKVFSSYQGPNRWSEVLKAAHQAWPYLSESASDSNAEDSTDGMCPECDECGSDIDHGTGFFHCNGCPFPGFDVCETCFPPREHEHHEVNFTYGVFPEFNPYSECVRGPSFKKPFFIW